MEATAAQADWLSANPEGEVRRLGPAQLGELPGELARPSLFAPARLVVVPDARPLLEGGGRAGEAAAQTLAGLAKSWDRGTSLLLCAATPAEPKGELAEYVRARGSVRWLPLPAPPKPWEEVRISPEQRRTLEEVLRRTAPEILAHPAVVEVLLDHLGFRPRELVQTAQRLLLGGLLDAEQVRAQLGPREQSVERLEDALLEGNAQRLAQLLGALAAGGELTNWRGERIPSAGVAPLLTAWLSRLLRNARTLAALARRAGLAAELDPQRCRQPRWYPAVFQRRLQPALEREIQAAGETELAALTPWQRQRPFRLAATYPDAALRRALARLGRLLPERDEDPARALAALTQVLLELALQPAAAVGTVPGE